VATAVDEEGDAATHRLYPPYSRHETRIERPGQAGPGPAGARGNHGNRVNRGNRGNVCTSLEARKIANQSLWYEATEYGAEIELNNASMRMNVCRVGDSFRRGLACFDVRSDA
jgi:hypothetical protein